MACFWPRRGDSSRNRVWNMHPVFRLADHAHCTRVVRRYELPCVVWLPFFIPALSRLPGHNPAQLAIFSAVGNVVRSTLSLPKYLLLLAGRRQGWSVVAGTLIELAGIL